MRRFAKGENKEQLARPLESTGVGTLTTQTPTAQTAASTARADRVVGGYAGVVDTHQSPGGNYVPWSTASKTVRACSNGWDVIPRCVPNGWSSQKTRNSSKPSSTATALESRT